MLGRSATRVTVRLATIPAMEVPRSARALQCTVAAAASATAPATTVYGPASFSVSVTSVFADRLGFGSSDIGNGSCIGNRACTFAGQFGGSDMIGNHSCLGDRSCFDVGQDDPFFSGLVGSVSRVGNNSCERTQKLLCGRAFRRQQRYRQQVVQRRLCLQICRRRGPQQQQHRQSFLQWRHARCSYGPLRWERRDDREQSEQHAIASRLTRIHAAAFRASTPPKWRGLASKVRVCARRCFSS